jgi:hypothetical protein
MALYHHDFPPWLNEADPRVRSNRWLTTLRPIVMRDRQFRKNFVRDVIVSATLESKPTVSAGSFGRLYTKPVVGMNVASSDLRRRNVFTPLSCYPADTTPRYFNYEADTVYVELERQ